MRLKIIIVLCGVLLSAVAVEPFAVMDAVGEGLRNGRDKFEQAAAFPRYQETDRDRAYGFKTTVVDLNHNWWKPFIWNDTAMVHQFNLISAQDDYTSATFSIFASKPFAHMEITVSALKGPGEIAPEQIRFFQMAPPAMNPRFKRSMLLTPELDNLQPGEQVNLLVMFNIPANAPGGLYKGEISVKAGDQVLVMPVVLRVMDFKLPEAGEFGFYLYGNLYNPKAAFNAAQKGFTGENLARYFEFCKTRRLNSMTIYDNVPELHYVNGQVTGEFTDMSLIAAAMRKSGLNGKLIIDLRDIGYWCNAVAQKLDTLGGKAPEGDIGITMAQRKSSTVPYPEKAKEIYAQAIRLLLAQAEKEQWPEIRLLADEEMGNQTALKIANYESFMPVIMQVCPELGAAVDNGIGYGRKQATEYGARDKVRHRQYNSWTEEALAEAAKDGAEVWTFNYDSSRLSFGFTQQRLNSRGNHQWADLWDAFNFQWQFTRLSGKGVVSSLAVEKIHEGCVDYAACEYLKQLIDEQEKSGNARLAEFGKQVLKDVSADLPVQGDTARNYGYLLSNENLNARRWQVFMAIEKLLDRPAAPMIEPGKPSVHIQKALQMPLKETNYVINLKKADGNIAESGVYEEKFWSPTIGPLTYLTEHEAQLKAKASTVEEFQRLNQPSHTVVNLACLPEGLAVYSLTNHVRPAGGFRYERVDDDGDMWQDDCMEFFFGLPNGKICRLLYNAAGAKTFINNGAIVPAADIRSYYKSPVNGSGGTSNKLLIPWRYFGLKQAPAAGTVWEFNVGREFHTNQAILSWARVANGFHERDKWGRLVFTDDGTAEVKIAPSITIEPNANAQVISGGNIRFNLESRASGLKQLPLEGTLTHSSGRKIPLSGQTLPVGAAEFILGTQGLEPGGWTLQLWIKGTIPAPANAVRFMILPSPWL